MKGIVMNLLEEMVLQELGIETWNRVLSECGLDGVYTSAARYEDKELFDLVGALSIVTGTPVNDLVYEFGRFMFPQFVRRYGELIEGELGLLGFLERIDDVIHVEVRKLYPDAETPVFRPERRSPSELYLQYRSKRRLCRLAEGLIDSAAVHFEENCEVRHTPCMHDGAEFCGIAVRIHG